MTPEKEIAHWAKSLRREGLRISQRKLSDETGIPLGTIRRFEQTGHIGLQAFLRIAKVLDALQPLLALARREEPKTFPKIQKEKTIARLNDELAMVIKRSTPSEVRQRNSISVPITRRKLAGSKKWMESDSTTTPPTPTTREIFLMRREAKWQFRRGLLLAIANILDKQPDQIWPDVSQISAKLLASPSPSIRQSTKRWIRFAGQTPESVVQTIRSRFTTDTPEGPRRHKLQDQSDGHPFSGCLSNDMLQQLRQAAEQNHATASHP